jgi:translocation protein SEC63
MPGARLDYDNAAFYHFFIAVLFIFLAPFSFFVIKRVMSFMMLRTQKYELKDKARTKEEQEKFEKIEQDKRRCSALFTKGFLCTFMVMVLGWCLFFFVVNLVNVDSEIATYDPFKILEIEHGASAREIKKAYRKQSLIYHPDKNKSPDAERKFMAIAKAYAALTDPVAKENWEKYGNPDGRQSLEVSIGLPKFLIDADNQNTVLIVYMFILIVCIPTAVWYYYSWSQQFGEDGIFFDTERMFMHPQVLSSNIQIKYLPELLSMAKEFEGLNDKNTKESATALQALDNYMKSSGLLPKTRKQVAGFFQQNPKRMSHLRAYWILAAHLNRRTKIVRKSKDLSKDLEKILSIAPKLIDSMLKIALIKTHYNQGNVSEWFVTIMNLLNFRQCLIQGIWLSENPKASGQFQSSLLQLPHFGEEQLRHVKKRRGKSRREEDLREYLRSSELRQTGKKRGQGEFTEQQIKDVQSIVKILPDFEVNLEVGVDDIEDNEFDYIAEGDIVTIDVHMTPFMEDSEKDDAGAMSEEVSECPLVHSFSYPFDIEETWWLFLIWEFEPPNRKGSVEQKLLMHKKITGQERIDSIKIYRDIKALKDELNELMKKKADKNSDENLSEDKKSTLRNRSKVDPADENAVLSKADGIVFDDDDDGIITTVDPIFELQEQIVDLRKKLKTRLQFQAGPPMKYKMKVIVKSSCYIGLDHTSPETEFVVKSRENLPQYKVHEEDKMLDMEPTLFDAMAGNWPDEEDDDFGSDDDNNDDFGGGNESTSNKAEGDVGDDFGSDVDD